MQRHFYGCACPTLICALFLLHSSPLRAAPSAPAKAVPPGARIILFADRGEYLLGENILWHYCIENTGREILSPQTGGDYRGGTRANRFKISATGPDGKPLADPAPRQWDMGGLSPLISLKPGERWFEQVWLLRYLRFEAPGTYTVRVFHDLGWGPKQEKDPREITTTLKLRMPTPEEARQVVQQMYDALKYSGPTWGKMSKPMANFSALQFPVYLPILKERASEGSVEAIEGIASIPTLEATRALVELLGHTNPAIIATTAKQLDRRVPITPPKDPKSIAPWTNDQWLVSTSWSPEIAPAIHNAALNLLRSTNDAAIEQAALMLRGLAESNDLARIMHSLDLLLVRYTNSSAPYWNAQPRPACGALAGACAAAIRAGAKPPPTPATPGEAVAFAAALGEKTGPPPASSETTVKLLQHPVPYVREFTARNLPKPWIQAQLQCLPGLIAGPDYHVRQAALELIVNGGLPAPKEPLLKILPEAQDSSMMFWVDEALKKADARFETAAIWARRLDDPKVAMHALCSLWTIVTGGTISGSFPADSVDAPLLPALKAKWTAFVEQHREALIRGQRFQLGDGELTRDLLPPKMGPSR